MEIAFIAVGIIIGGLIGWLFAKQKFSNTSVKKSDFERLQQEFNEASSKLLAENDKSNRLDTELNKATGIIQQKEEELRTFTGDLATLKSELDASKINEISA